MLEGRGRQGRQKTCIRHGYGVGIYFNYVIIYTMEEMNISFRKTIGKYKQI